MMPDCEERIAKLEHELDEMAEALSHAWDELVPFLDAAPTGNTTELGPLVEQVAAALTESRARQAQTERELEIAASIQRSLQPRPPRVPSLDLSASWKPAKVVGGDAWGWVEQPNGRIAYFILDVAGKGLPASLAASSLHTAIRLTLRLGLSPVEALQTLNDEFYAAYTETSLLSTATIVAIDPLTGALEHANAGHPPSLIRMGGRWQSLAATMPPLGALEGLAPDAQCATLAPGDLLILYSDGFSEIETTHGLWGEGGIQAIVPVGARQAKVVQQVILAAAEHLQKQQSARDDQTLIVLAYTGKGA